MGASRRPVCCRSTRGAWCLPGCALTSSSSRAVCRRRFALSPPQPGADAARGSRHRPAARHARRRASASTTPTTRCAGSRADPADARLRRDRQHLSTRRPGRRTHNKRLHGGDAGAVGRARALAAADLRRINKRPQGFPSVRVIPVQPNSLGIRGAGNGLQFAIIGNESKAWRRRRRRSSQRWKTTRASSSRACRLRRPSRSSRSRSTASAPPTSASTSRACRGIQAHARRARYRRRLHRGRSYR